MSDGRLARDDFPGVWSMFQQPLELRWIASQRNQMAQRVEAWANINTHSHNTKGLAILAGLVKEQLAKLGAEPNELTLPAADSIAANGQIEHFALGPVLRARK